ncbi:MAG: cell division protein ZapA [Ruminococcus sp.]|nr:cell division protein ZapA [Ruminococcus sp.]
MNKNEIRVRIFNKEYCLMTDETKEYTDKLAADLNNRMTQLMESKTMMSHQDAAALIALETYDELIKARDSVEGIREQIKDYADEAAIHREVAEKATARVAELEERVAQLEKEVKLRTKLSSEKTNAEEIISHDIQKALNGTNAPYNAMSNQNRNFR